MLPCLFIHFTLYIVMALEKKKSNTQNNKNFVQSMKSQPKDGVQDILSFD